MPTTKIHLPFNSRVSEEFARPGQQRSSKSCAIFTSEIWGGFKRVHKARGPVLLSVEDETLARRRELENRCCGARLALNRGAARASGIHRGAHQSQSRRMNSSTTKARQITSDGFDAVGAASEKIDAFLVDLHACKAMLQDLEDERVAFRADMDIGICRRRTQRPPSSCIWLPPYGGLAKFCRGIVVGIIDCGPKDAYVLSGKECSNLKWFSNSSHFGPRSSTHVGHPVLSLGTHCDVDRNQ